MLPFGPTTILNGSALAVGSANSLKTGDVIGKFLQDTDPFGRWAERRSETRRRFQGDRLRRVAELNTRQKNLFRDMYHECLKLPPDRPWCSHTSDNGFGNDPMEKNSGTCGAVLVWVLAD
jgi:hypothetical protein